MQLIEIYVASKKKHAEKLLAFFRKQEGVHLCSRWMETANMEINKNKPVPHWQQENFTDIPACHFAILYAEPEDHLVVAIGEIFFAMAYAKPVYVIGYKGKDIVSGDEVTKYHDDFADWTLNPARVNRVCSLEEAIKDIKTRVARDGLKV